MEAMSGLQGRTSTEAASKDSSNATYEQYDYGSISSSPEAFGIKGSEIELSRIIISAGLFIIVLLTIFGNILVLVAFATQKKLRSSNFMLYIANLAVTDLAVAMLAMSFYTFDVLLGYWPFGEVLCGIWIFFDYGMTFASVFTLVAISMDRFWSVTWSLHYRNYNSKKKTFVIIGVVWLLVLAIWLGPCVVDRLKWSEPNVCIWEPSNNREFVIFIAIFGHHTPCFIMVFCYIWVFCRMRKRRRMIKPLKGMIAGRTSTFVEEATVENATNSSTAVGKPPTVHMTSLGEPQENMETAHNVADVARAQVSSHEEATDSAGTISKKKGLSSAEREKKIFVTLSYVIISYLMCWVPFHIIFDLSAINPDFVPSTAYVFTFWLTYFNSTLNPLLYAFSSSEFRSAFKNVMKCKWDMSRN